jgi:hypothetical protein
LELLGGYLLQAYSIPCTMGKWCYSCDRVMIDAWWIVHV